MGCSHISFSVFIYISELSEHKTKINVGMDGNWKLSCTSTYIFSEVLSVKARFAGGEMILVVWHSQHLKVWQVWQVWQVLQGEIKDEYEAKEDTGFE